MHWPEGYKCVPKCYWDVTSWLHTHHLKCRLVGGLKYWVRTIDHSRSRCKGQQLGTCLIHVLDSCSSELQVTTTLSCFYTAFCSIHKAFCLHSIDITQTSVTTVPMKDYRNANLSKLYQCSIEAKKELSLHAENKWRHVSPLSPQVEC